MLSSFLERFQRPKTEGPLAYSLVDIGQDTTKAVVILCLPDQNDFQVVGHSVVNTEGRDICGGRLEAEAIFDPVNKALTEAEDSAQQYIGQKIVPDDVIFALPGRGTMGRLFTVQQTRPNGQTPISEKELNTLRSRAERLVKQGLVKEEGSWRPLAVTDAGIYLDERLAMGGVGLTGTEVSFSVFGVAGQVGAMRALETLAERLNLEVANIMAASQALAAIIPNPEAIVLDTGAAGTDIYLIWDNVLVATDWVPFGGQFFTQSLAHAMSVDDGKAQTLKHAYGSDELDASERNRINSYLSGARQRWYKGVMDSLGKIAAQADSQVKSKPRTLPHQILLVGAGNLLPGLDRMLKSDAAPFVRAPEVDRFNAQSAVPMKDLTDGFDANVFTLALSLSVGLPNN